MGSAAYSDIDSINEKEMEEAIKKSGYILEQNVATLLNDSGYTVYTNRKFMDLETSKSLESDVYAYRDISIYENKTYGLYPTLICECKNSLPIVFLINDDRVIEPIQSEIYVSGIPCKIWKNNNWISITELLEIDRFHHYWASAKNASNLCFTFERKNGKWIANDTDDLRNTFRKLTKALEYEVNEDFKNMGQGFAAGEKDFIDLSFYYPVVICKGEIYSAHVRNNSSDVKLKKSKHIQYSPEYNSLYQKEIVSYQIDVITEDYLPSYLDIINNETVQIQNIFKKHKKTIMDSILKIVKECTRHKISPDSLREYLELRD